LSWSAHDLESLARPAYFRISLAISAQIGLFRAKSGHILILDDFCQFALVRHDFDRYSRNKDAMSEFIAFWTGISGFNMFCPDFA
jgi:hypothetical protein